MQARRTVAYVTSHEDYIRNAGRIKRADIAETVIIKLDRQREFSGIFRWAGGEFFSFKTGISGGPVARARLPICDIGDAVVPLSTLPGRKHLRSAEGGQYDVPRVLSRVGSRAFSVASPRAWNQLFASLRHTNCVATFKRHLKTILFTAAYGVTDFLLNFNSNHYVVRFHLFSSAVQYCKGRFINTSL